MLKMLTTQLNGLFQRISDSEEEAIEETARLLAQATFGHGRVFFVCYDELQAIEMNALHAEEQFTNLHAWNDSITLTEQDRVCIFTRHADHPEALAFAKKLYEQFIPFGVVTSEKADDAGAMTDYAYTYISMGIRKGLLPNDLGERIVVPHTLAASFIYEAMKIAYDEMVDVE